MGISCVTFTGELRDFQGHAQKRMIDRGAFLLVHDLGLGKTVTSIATIEDLIDSGDVECCLVLAPASVKWQWAARIAEFTDGALVKVIEGSKANRMAQYRSVKRGDCEYVMMNYEQIVTDWDIIRFLHWDAIICDEITYIKSPGSIRSRHVKRLDAPYRIGLSGQPIENRPEDLYSIMEWVDPDILGQHNIFDNLFIIRKSGGQVFGYKNLKELHKRMGPVMDRKSWADPDIQEQMPKIVPEDYLIDWNPAAEKLYTVIASELLGMIRSMPKFSTFDVMDHYAGVGGSNAQGEIMTRITALQMLCDHPALLKLSANAFDDPNTKAGSKYIAGLKQAHLLDKVKQSPKLNYTMELMGDILDANPANKIVLFSFFKPMLSPIIASKLKVDYALFTGDVSPKAREKARVRFNEDPKCRVLLSSDAGGIGVDLPGANYLISYDLPWSAGKLRQRMGRIMRLSSVWPNITLISMMMRGSIEERKYDMLEQKMGIADAWMGGKGVAKDGTFNLTLGSLGDFLEEMLAA